MVLLILAVFIGVIIMLWGIAYLYFKGGNHTDGQSIQKRLEAATSASNVYEATLFVENTSGEFSESYTYGGKDIDTPLIIASATKMFTTACILKFQEEGRLRLEDKISLYIDKDVLAGLHIYKNKEYSFDLKISDLLFQTSGLPDYFTKSIQIDHAIQKEDAFLTFGQYIEETKKLSSVFPPNTGNKAYYADINFDLLGEVLEHVIGKPLAEIYKEYIFIPLEMKYSYLPTKAEDFVPYIYKGSEKLERPLFIASCRASGGCVSTARDMMTFSKAFWGGKLFSKEVFQYLSVYRKLQFEMMPIQYGGGYMRLSLNGINSFFLSKGDLLGHSGTTGFFVFYYPEKDLHFVGDFSQFEDPGKSIQFLMQLGIVVK